MSAEAPDEVRALASERAERRSAKDYAAADDLRDRITELGWTVVDMPGGWRLEAAASDEGGGPDEVVRLQPKEVPSVLAAEPDRDVSLHWLVEGWPEDVKRAIASFRANEGSRSVHYVVTDVTGQDPSSFGDDVEVVSLAEGTGWGAARNAGLKRSRGRFVMVLDGSVEASGDVFGPLEAALDDTAVGVCGPFGIVTGDLQQFDEALGPGDCDAVEGYLMAFRRDVLSRAGLFDEKFRWYRTADIEFSFRVKDQGLRAVVVPVPVVKHQHRMWFNTPPAVRAKWSKRNYYRFLDQFRGRFDLTVAGTPPVDHSHDHDHDHDHDHEDERRGGIDPVV